MTTVLEDQELSYSDLKDRIREEVSTRVVTKDRILLLAKKLEDDLTKKEEICSQICKDLGDVVSDRYIRMVLPDEYKKQTKRRDNLRNTSAPQQEEQPEEMLTDGSISKNEDEAVPVDPKAILGFAREVKAENNENQEYEEIIKDKDKAIEELRAENNVLKQRNPNNTPSLDARIQISNLEEANKKLQSELELAKHNQKEPEFTKASDIPVVPDIIPEPTPTKIRPFIIKKEQITTYYNILGKSFNHDIQCFLCEDSWLHMLPPFQTTYSTDVQKDHAQKFELLTQEQENATQTGQEQDT